jgi:hypothetical protein
MPTTLPARPDFMSGDLPGGTTDTVVFQSFEDGENGARSLTPPR